MVSSFLCYILLIALYFAIAIIAIRAVRFMGPVAINYVLEETYDSDNGQMNVIYRVVSPVLVCGFLTLLPVTVFSALKLNVTIPRVIPVIFYWIILASIKIRKRRMISLFAFLCESILSIVVAYLVDFYVTERLMTSDYLVLDDSNIAFELELAIFYVMTQMVVSLIIRKQYKTHVESNGLPSDHQAPSRAGLQNSRYSLIDTSERRLFSYEKRYGHLLSKRYDEDPLLRIIFFTIMAIEDSNRPKDFRLLERIACVAGIARTTGIMQQQSKKPLSDEDSILLADSYICTMWDSFLQKYARSQVSTYNPNIIRFGKTWYEYDYQRLAAALGSSFSLLYGDYCGTRNLSANAVFLSVRKFYEGNRYGLMPNKIVSSSMLFPRELSWLAPSPAYWKDGQTIAVTDLAALSTPMHRYSYYAEGNEATESAIKQLCDTITQQAGCVTEVSLVDGVRAIVSFASPFSLNLNETITNPWHCLSKSLTL